MSDDLVKRLRELNTFEWHARPATTKEICFAAADRIEKLEAALRDVLLWGNHCEACDYDDDWAKIEERARKALEGKDD